MKPNLVVVRQSGRDLILTRYVNGKRYEIVQATNVGDYEPSMVAATIEDFRRRGTSDESPPRAA